MDKQKTVAVTRDVGKPEDEQTRVQRFVMSLSERVTTADIANGDWVCGRYPTTASDAVNALSSARIARPRTSKKQFRSG